MSEEPRLITVCGVRFEVRPNYPLQRDATPSGYSLIGEGDVVDELEAADAGFLDFDGRPNQAAEEAAFEEAHRQLGNVTLEDYRYAD